MWEWSQQFNAVGFTKLTTVTALTVDPQGQKLACYGENTLTNDIDGKEGFLFLLDVATGKTLSDLTTLVHSDYAYDVASAGLVLRDNGMVYWAENSNGSSQPNAYE